MTELDPTKIIEDSVSAEVSIDLATLEQKKGGVLILKTDITASSLVDDLKDCDVVLSPFTSDYNKDEIDPIVLGPFDVDADEPFNFDDSFELETGDGQPFTQDCKALTVFVWMEFKDSQGNQVRTSAKAYIIQEDTADTMQLKDNQIENLFKKIWKSAAPKPKPQPPQPPEPPEPPKKDEPLTMDETADKTGLKVEAYAIGKPKRINNNEVEVKMIVKNKTMRKKYQNVKVGVQFIADKVPVGPVIDVHVGSLAGRDKKKFTVKYPFKKGMHATNIEATAYIPD